MIPRHLQITIGLLLIGVLISGIYIVRLKHREEAKTAQEAEDRTLAPPAEGKQERIRMLVAYDDEHALRWRETSVFMPEDRSLRAREAIKTVLAEYLQKPSPHYLAKGSGIRDVYLMTNGAVVVDTTPEFAEGHPSGILPEELTLISLIETLAANVPNVTRVKFIVDGKERETLAGHADLMSFYDVQTVHELAKEFE
ncbi:MAG TPA: GerMN domain-containing protein [Candidatus Angelobacter sp.]|nr:GerMN domain-containing protein [Candidatus Angelobacter sp.]